MAKLLEKQAVKRGRLQAVGESSLGLRRLMTAAVYLFTVTTTRFKAAAVYLFTMAAFLALSFMIIHINLKSQDNPIVMGLSCLLFLLILRSSAFRVLHRKLSELTLEAIVVIVLTLVFIQVSYPLFSPRVEMVSSEIMQGYVDNSGGYVYEVLTATVRKPMSMACGRLCGEYCTDISFFHNIREVISAPDVRIKKLGNRTRVCTYGDFDLITRVLEFNAEYPNPMDYSMGDMELTVVADYNLSAGRYVYFNEAVNKMPFPIVLREKTVTFRITNQTTIPVYDNATGDTHSLPLYDTIKTNYQGNNCSQYDLGTLISNSLRLSDYKPTGASTIGGQIKSVRINDNTRTIEISMNIYTTLEPGVNYPYNIVYKPVRCIR